MHLNYKMAIMSSKATHWIQGASQKWDKELEAMYYTGTEQ